MALATGDRSTSHTDDALRDMLLRRDAFTYGLPPGRDAWNGVWAAALNASCSAARRRAGLAASGFTLRGDRLCCPLQGDKLPARGVVEVRLGLWLDGA